jgi:hypothetical protein
MAFNFLCSEADMTSLIKEGDGRYVVQVGGQRTGLVLGGGTKWAAELRDGQLLGHFATRKAATAALAADAACPVWLTLRKAVEDRPTPFLVHYREDFYKLDRETVREWGSATDFVFFLRPNGTHLVPLDLDWMRREIKGIADAFDPKIVGYETEIYWVRARTGDQPLVKRVTRDGLASLLAKPARYRIQGSSLIECPYGGPDQILADLRIDNAPGAGSVRPQGQVNLVFRDDPFKEHVKIGMSGAFSAIRGLTQSLFGLPLKIDAVYKGRVLDSWAPKPSAAS